MQDRNQKKGSKSVSNYKLVEVEVVIGIIFAGEMNMIPMILFKIPLKQSISPRMFSVFNLSVNKVSSVIHKIQSANSNGYCL